MLPRSDYQEGFQVTAIRRSSAELPALEREEQARASTSTSAPEEDKATTYTVAEAIDSIGLGRYQWALLCYTGLVWLSDAMEMMIISLLGPAVACEWQLSADQEGLISTVVFIGALIGANAFGALSDAYGRRVGFFMTAVFTFVFGFGSAFAPSFQALLALRFFVGLGLGGGHVPFALFMELVPTAQRGLMLVALQSFWTVGTMIEALIGWAVLTPLGWRWLLGISSFPLLVLALLYPVVPESPYWLAAMGKTGRAEEALAKLARVNRKQLPPGTLRHNKKSSAGSKKSGVVGELAVIANNIKSTFMSGLALTTGLLLFIWFANALTYYGEVLLTTVIQTQTSTSECSNRRLRMSSHDMQDVFITSLAELPGLLIAALLLDTIGRKRTMLLAMIAIVASLGSLMVSDSAKLVKMFVARAASMGGFTVLFIYTPEVYPTRVRSFALGMNNSMSRLGAVLSPFVSVNLGQRGHLTAAEGVVVGFCVIAACCICALPRETKGKTLESENQISGEDNGGDDEIDRQQGDVGSRRLLEEGQRDSSQKDLLPT